MRTPWLIALLLGAPALAQPVGDPDNGRAIAADTCIACHAVLPGESMAPDRLTLPFFEGVPVAFQDIADAHGVTEAMLHAWLTTSHPTMPDFVLTPEEVEDVTAYILSLRTVPAAN